MKFTKYTFLMLGLASLFSVSGIDAAFATACNKKNVAAGKFCHAGGAESDCRPGCYCLGASKVKGVNNSQVDQACEGKWSSPKSELNRVGVQYCPDAFPKSASGAKKETECYYINSSGKKLYYQKHTCSAGQYLPKDSDTCKNCGDIYTVSDNKYCPGVSDVYPSKIGDMGVKDCPSGQTPNSTLKSCTSTTSSSSSSSSNNTTIHCYAGEYMPENSTTCKPCNFFMYCPGGDYKTNSYADGADWYCHFVEVDRNDVLEYHGITAPVMLEAGITEDGLAIPTLNGGPCEKMKDVTVKCEKGYYLHKMRRFCDKCPDTTACKGGTFHLSLRDNQGLGEKCTAPAHPNNNTGKCERDTVSCAEGTYLPTNASACTNCRTNFVCTGGTFETNPAYDKGIGEECIPPARPDHRAGKCVRDTVNCIKGTYLPANSPLGTECSACPSNKVCPGGSFEIMRNIDQGVLDKEKISVEPGYYLPKNSDEPKKCTSTSKYCPGGKYEPSTSRDQGIVDCPKNSRANDAKTACTITLTKKQLMYGVNGTGGKYSENALQCWAKTNEAEYKACMGLTSDGSYKPTGNTGTGKVFKEAQELDFIKGVAAKEKANVMQASFGGLEK